MSNSNGLYRKFKVTRTDGSSKRGGKHEKCSYFVLDLVHDPFARTALEAYTKACEIKHPDLAEDLRNRVAIENPKQSVQAVLGEVVYHPDAMDCDHGIRNVCDACEGAEPTAQGVATTVIGDHEHQWDPGSTHPFCKRCYMPRSVYDEQQAASAQGARISITQCEHGEPMTGYCAHCRGQSDQASQQMAPQPHVHYAVAGCTCMPCFGIYKEMCRKHSVQETAVTGGSGEGTDAS